MDNKEYLDLLGKIDSIQDHIENSTTYRIGFAELYRQLSHFYRVLNTERMEINRGDNG